MIITLALAWIVSIGMLVKVHAEEVEKNGIEYKVSQTGVTPSRGPIQWNKDGDVVTVKLTGNILGMITINEGGSYILDANNYAIYPKGQNNAVDGNFMLGADVTLTLKGNGKYYPGKDNLIYLFSGNTKILHIESGVFWNNDISASKIYADRVGNDNVRMMSLKGEALTEKM